MTARAITSIVTELTGEIILFVNQFKDLTGEEREHKVIEMLCTLDDCVMGLNIIPNALEAKIIQVGVDVVQATILKKIDLKAFVKTNYNRLKRLGQMIIPGGKTGRETE